MAAYQPPSGWVPNQYWSAYAESFAGDGSEDQLIAALTGSVPQEWASRFMPNLTGGRVALRKKDSDEYDDEATRKFNDGISKSNSRFGGWQNANAQNYMDTYSRALQNRLKNDFKSKKDAYRMAGTANLFAQADEATKDDFDSIDSNMNARGLLYSGLRDDARSKAAASRAGEARDMISGYENQLSDMESQLNSDVFGSEIQAAVNQADLNDITTQNLYRRMERNIQQTGQDAKSALGFGKSIGSVLGKVKGKQNG